MKRAWIIIAGLLVATRVMAGPRSCPGVAPPEWGIGAKSLETIRVMSYRSYEQIGADRDYYSAPPWDEREKSGFIYQTWYINSDAPDFKYEVDCTYDGTERYISLDVAKAHKCTARWRARRDHSVVPYTLNFSCK